MKTILYIFLLLSIKANATDVTQDTTISGTWNLQGVVLNIYGKISGTGTIQNAVISANPYIQIFDTTVSLLNCKTKEFSVIWYGANPSIEDNYNALQKAINTCNNSMDLFIPRGNYSFSQPLTIYTKADNIYIGSCINISGEGNMLSDATILTYTGIESFAIGFQMAKGGSIHNLKIQGQFVSPTNNGIPYYSLTQDQFNDASGRCAATYIGLCIDYDGSLNTGGSTGFKVYDLWIDGFDILYGVTRNYSTFNADILIFTNIRCGNGRIGFQSTQAQAKGNEINNIMSWDNIHTLIDIGTALRAQAGNYSINGGNIAGGCIRVFNINQNGWFSSSVNNLYCESIGQVGIITTGDGVYNPPFTVSNSDFEFAFPSEAGTQTLLTSNSNFIKFNSCMFRYYGEPSDTLNFSGEATYDNCSFSGTVVNPDGSVYLNYPLPVPVASTIKMSVK